MHTKKTAAILLAVLAAAFYAINVPFSKLLLEQLSPTFLASLLYFGAGIGIGILYLSHPKKHAQEKKLTKQDLPYTIGMILLDIAAPILLIWKITVPEISPTKAPSRLFSSRASFPDSARFSLPCASANRCRNWVQPLPRSRWGL